MQISSLRQILACEISRRSLNMEKKRIDRRHIFETLVDSIVCGDNIDERLRLVHEFSLIKRIVEFADADQLGEARRWYNNVIDARRRYNPSTLAADALDAVLLPALALVEFKEGQEDESLGTLMRSIDRLYDHFRDGILDAGLAVFEQRLNVIRILTRSGNLPRLQSEIVAFIELLANDDFEGAGSGLRGDDDAIEVLDHFVNKAMYKAFVYFDRSRIRDILLNISSLDLRKPDTMSLKHSSLVCAKIINSSGPHTDIGEVDVDLLIGAPFCIMSIVDAETGSTADDGLTKAIANHADHKWCKEILAERGFGSTN